MSKSNFDDVGEFHLRFGLHNITATSLDDVIDGRSSMAGPTMAEADEELMGFRIKFLREELQEFEDGYAEQDIAQMADALIDLVYVAMGTAHFLGLPWQELWNEVQAANMAKIRAAKDGSDSKRGSSFDVVKPEGWTPPNIENTLKNYGFDIQPSLFEQTHSTDDE